MYLTKIHSIYKMNDLCAKPTYKKGAAIRKVRCRRAQAVLTSGGEAETAASHNELDCNVHHTKR